MCIRDRNGRVRFLVLLLNKGTLVELVVEIFSDIQQVIRTHGHKYQAECQQQSHGFGKGPVSQLHIPALLSQSDVYAGVGFPRSEKEAASAVNEHGDKKDSQRRSKSRTQVCLLYTSLPDYNLQRNKSGGV